jgi:hypothetical protein
VVHPIERIGCIPQPSAAREKIGSVRRSERDGTGKLSSDFVEVVICHRRYQIDPVTASKGVFFIPSFSRVLDLYSRIAILNEGRHDA